jgi:1-acyl-sn-glycerol-3-phosphate acyltransferase
MITKLFTWWFKLKGWKVYGTIPSHIRKAVVIAAPHTSQWDFIYSLAAFRILNLKVNYVAKKELFKFPVKQILEATGGIPVKRDKNQQLVELMIDRINKADDLYMMIPAEGTRKWVKRWKSGFYHVAQRANVPVMMGYLDYKNKKAGFGPPVYLTGDKAVDMAVIRNFYKDITAKHPEKWNPDAIKLDASSDEKTIPQEKKTFDAK